MPHVASKYDLTFSIRKYFQYLVMKRVTLVQQEIAEKHFEELRRFMNTILQAIICPDQLIPKIPRVLGKNVIRYIKFQCAQIYLDSIDIQ